MGSKAGEKEWLCALRFGFRQHTLIRWLRDPPPPSRSLIFPNMHCSGMIVLHWSAVVRAHPALVRQGHHHACLHQCPDCRQELLFKECVWWLPQANDGSSIQGVGSP